MAKYYEVWRPGLCWLVACGLSACGASEDATVDGLELAIIELEVVSPGPSARCLVERLTNTANGREEEYVFELTPGVDQRLELAGAPAGDVELAGYVTDGFDGERCTGRVTYEANVQRFRLLPGEVAYVGQEFRARGDVVIDGRFETDIFDPACTPDSNVALHTVAALSDAGWGGGVYDTDLTDGLTRYADTWAHGLAFTGGPSGWAGAGCGPRQMTLDLGAERQFQMARLYHHGDYHIPAADTLEYSSDAVSWTLIDQTRSVRFDLRTDADAGYYGATPTEHVFAPVTARYFRYAFDNCNMLQPTSDSHGWLYEAELLSCSAE